MAASGPWFAAVERGETAQKIPPMPWLDGQAEDAARFSVSLFEDAGIGHISHLPDGSPFVVDCDTQQEVADLTRRLRGGNV